MCRSSVINHPTGRHGFEVGDDAGTRLVIDRTVDFVKTASSRGYQAALRNGLDETTSARCSSDHRDNHRER
jgi:hypothetical protein